MRLRCILSRVVGYSEGAIAPFWGLVSPSRVRCYDIVYILYNNKETVEFYAARYRRYENILRSS